MQFNRVFSLAVISLIAAANLPLHLAVTAQTKSTPSVTQLIDQGKELYRTQRFNPALAKFEAALKMEPNNDEALGLAAVTAFRLDNQPQSRDFFVRRAGLRARIDERRPERRAVAREVVEHCVMSGLWLEPIDRL